MSRKKYNPISSIGGIIFLSVFLYFFFKEKVKEKETPTERQIERCRQFYQEKYEGTVVKKSPGRQWMYTLSSGDVFIRYPYCSDYDSMIQVSDLILKPKNSFDLFLYKKANEDSFIFLPCAFDCDSLIEE